MLRALPLSTAYQPLNALGFVVLVGTFLVSSCGKEPVSTVTETNTRVDLINPITELVVGAGESKIVASFGTTDLDPDREVELRLKARYDTTSFSEGSFPLMRITVNGQPLSPEEVKNDPSCFMYPNCFWGPDCVDTCYSYFIGDFSLNLVCGEETFIHGVEPGMFDTQVSPNFTNHMMPQNQSGEPHQFYIDPAVSGDPYAFSIDLTDRARNSDQLTIVVENPFSEYQGHSVCTGGGATEGNLVLGSVRVRQIPTE